MHIRKAANAALASETGGQTLDNTLLRPGVEAMHRSSYGTMETVYRGPESHEEAPPC